MSRVSRAVTLLVVAFASAAHAQTAPASRESLDWRDGKQFATEGLGWPEVPHFERLPDRAQSLVNPTAWAQSRQSAGVAIRFLTSASTLHARWSLTSAALAMPHMPATGVSGLDLYARDPSGTFRFIANGRPTSQDANLAKFALPPAGSQPRECLLYLPLYNAVRSLELAAVGGDLAQPPPRGHRPLVIYGTSITQGGCASRPGMAWPSILGRMLDREVINLGFSGSGDMKPPVGELLAELDPDAYLIDCLWNMGRFQDDVETRVRALVSSVRTRHPSTPILFIGQTQFQPGAGPTELSRRQAAAVEKLQHEGVANLTLIPAESILGTDGEATVDGVHSNDLGMMREAEAVAPIVRAVLK